MEQAHEEMRCPECHAVLEEIKAIALSSMLSGEGYLCKACKMLYYHDLQPMARVI
jgi:hypothetical protein